MKSRLFVVVVGLTAITWYCGLMFNCGCSWPWDGLYKYCNIHNPQAMHQCPWCAWAVAGILSVILSLWAGWKASSLFLDHDLPILTTPLRILQRVIRIDCNIGWQIFTGVIAIIAMATLTGWLSGYLQNHPFLALFIKYSY